MLKMLFGETLTFDALVGDVCIGVSVNFETDGRAGGRACAHAHTGTHRQIDRDTYL